MHLFWQAPSPREPRTYELRDAEWIEDAATRRLRPPLWLIIPVALAAMTGLVLIAFAAVAALATGGLARLRARLLRMFAR
ncbi:MAG TPA: hypothetical protein VLC47_02355 [Burkholderiales bacterium]|nr:hypothetical protein [Burkholderiales bacterium]